MLMQTGAIQRAAEPIGGVEYRRWLAEHGSTADVRRYEATTVEPAEPDDVKRHRKASSSDVEPPQEELPPLTPLERWAFDFAWRCEAYVTRDCADVLTGWVAAWGEFEVALLSQDTDPWEWWLETLASRGVKAAIDDLDEIEIEREKQALAYRRETCFPELRASAREQYIRRIQNLTGVDIIDSVCGWSAGEIWDIWQAIRYATIQGDEKVSEDRVWELVDLMSQ